MNQAPGHLATIDASFSAVPVDPAVVWIYSPFGRGKSAATVAAFPLGAYVVQRNAIVSAPAVLGWKPFEIRSYDLMQIIDVIIPLAKRAGYNAISIDDFSFIAEALVQQLGGSGWQFWQALRALLLRFRQAARDAGIHVVINSHETGPHDHKGRFIRGGPKLPMREVTEDLPALFDVILRVGTEPQYAQQYGWPACFKCDPNDTNWISKDRFNVCGSTTPLNLGEILRAAGYAGDHPHALRRAPGLEWQDGIVEWAAQMIQGGQPDTQVFGQVAQYAQQAYTPPSPELFAKHLVWTLNDVRARVHLRKNKPVYSALSAYGLSASQLQLQGV